MTDRPGRVYVIAEAGVNHDGEIHLAHALVEAAAHAGADSVKFQTFEAATLATKRATKAEYQDLDSGSEESQIAMLRRLQLPRCAYSDLMATARKCGIDFLSTPFDRESLRFLLGLGLPALRSAPATSPMLPCCSTLQCRNAQ